MSILQDIEYSERKLIAEANYWRAEAEYWKKRYWDETMAGIKHSNEMFGHMLKALIEKKPE